jgi:glycosyltransferase involved in cell wall biosynthesis
MKFVSVHATATPSMTSRPLQPAHPSPQRRNPTLSLVIPCYDEAQTLPLLVRRIEESFTAEHDTEVILVDNGSTDESPAVMASLAGHPVIRTIRVDVNQGYGFGILAGLRAARGRFLGWTHADMQADPADAIRALAVIRGAESEALYVKGRRYGRAFNEVLFTIGMSVFETVLLRTRLWDINAQPNIFSRSFYEAVAAGAPHDWALDLYFYHAARQRGVRMVRFPVRFGARAHGASHWNVDWRAKKRFIARTMQFSFELRERVSKRRAS